MHLVGFIIRIDHDARSPERQFHCYCISAVDCTSSFCFLKNELFDVCSSMLWFSSIVMKSDWLVCNLIIVCHGVSVVLSDLIEMN